MAEPARRLWTLEEFLALDDGTDTGATSCTTAIFVDVPALHVHGAGHASRGARSSPKWASYRPSAPTAWYQADLAVTVIATGQWFIPEPVLIAEVLSPSTATTDRDRKLPDYRTIPSLQDVLVVSSTEPRIQDLHHEQDGWKIDDLRGRAPCVSRCSTSRWAGPSCTPVSCPQANPGRASGDVVGRHHVRP